jgi:hypothetical protein
MIFEFFCKRVNMECAQAQDWMLRADRPGLAEQLPADLVEHLGGCGSCQNLLRRVQRLEKAWRELPLPASADVSRESFLRRLGNSPTPAPAKSLRLAIPARWAVAATILLALGLSIWLISSTQQARAASDVIERLIDWNLELSEADPGQREEVFARQERLLQADVEKSRLSAEDRALAESLLENGRWLRGNGEPIDAADRFDEVADQLLSQLQLAARRNDGKKAEKLARQYGRVAERGIDAKLARVQAVEGEKKKKLDKIMERNARRLQELEQLHELMPGASKKELKKILEQSHKKNKDKVPSKQSKNTPKG